MKIGLLSDTHAYWDDRYEKYFSECDEIWHAGDIGSMSVADRLSQIKPLRAVYGNIDGHLERLRFPRYLNFECEGIKVLITHIGGYPGRYAPEILKELNEFRPTLFICGHSHIAKVKYDAKRKLLHINPGAAGKQGFHAVRTLVRFELTAGKILNLDMIELRDEEK
jgi:phosphoesterase, MJ0936 family